MLQQSIDPSLFMKEELSGKESRLGETLAHLQADLFQGIDGVRADCRVDVAGMPRLRAKATYFAKVSSVYCRKASTAPLPLKLPESTTPAETKTKLLKCPGMKRMLSSMVCLPRPL